MNHDIYYYERTTNYTEHSEMSLFRIDTCTQSRHTRTYRSGLHGFVGTKNTRAHLEHVRRSCALRHYVFLLPRCRLSSPTLKCAAAPLLRLPETSALDGGVR